MFCVWKSWTSAGTRPSYSIDCQT
ncbi:hypothetical protein LINPERHAP2_LOCUS43282 [Linum perenne]